MNASQTLKLYTTESRYEWLKTLRMPGFVLPSLLFPVVFYSFFGIIFNPSGSSSGAATYLLATYGVFGVIGPALFGFGVGLAIEREQGWLALKRISPAPAMAYFTAKTSTAMIFAALIIIELFAVAALFGKVAMATSDWLFLAAILLVGTIPFCAMGLALGSWSRGKSAPALVNLIYLPLAFLSGLWIPIQMMPAVIQELALALPPYHLAQLALKVLGKDQGYDVLLHIGYLAVFTAICLWVAQRGLKRADGQGA